jgi:hypothetical protein
MSTERNEILANQGKEAGIDNNLQLGKNCAMVL